LVRLSGDASPLEASDLVVNDTTVIGLLSGSSVFADTITALQEADFDPAVLISEELPLERTAEAVAPRPLPPSIPKGIHAHLIGGP
jgi:hypothetical protein